MKRICKGDSLLGEIKIEIEIIFLGISLKISRICSSAVSNPNREWGS